MLTPTAIAFDLDGTLIDSRGDIVAATNHALRRSGRAALPAPVIVHFVGDGARSLCARAARLPETDPAVDGLVDDFAAYYLAHPVDSTRWMPGAKETITALAERMPGVALAVCTNKPAAITAAVLAGLGVRDRFRAVVAGGDTPDKKPSPGPLLRLAELVGQPPAHMVMVGDGPQDIEAARAAGMRSIGIESGYGARGKLEASRPDVMLASFAELPEVVRRWSDATTRISGLPFRRR